MGADFMYAVCPRCELTQERKKRIKDTIRAISDEELLDAVISYCALGLDDESTPAQIRVELYKAVLENAEIENRETSWVRFDGMDWIANITGGMSWGDSPTESFDSMAGINDFESVYELMKEFSREDLVIHNNRAFLVSKVHCNACGNEPCVDNCFGRKSTDGT